MFARSILLPLGLAALAMATGCGSPVGEFAPVSGVVTLDQKPVANAQVSFQPRGTTENPGPGSVGFTDATGRYELKTVRSDPGAVPGPHDVSIIPATDQAPLPAKYNSQSELTFEVPPGGTDAANFDLKSK